MSDTRNMVFATLGHFTVAVHGKRPPTDDEWKEYLDAQVAPITRGANMRFLVVTEGGAPTAVQRMQMNELVAEFTKSNPDCIRTAIITSSSMVRGVVTAISWFRPIARAFSPDHIQQAFAFLEVPQDQRSEIEQMITTLKSKLHTGL